MMHALCRVGFPRVLYTPLDMDTATHVDSTILRSGLVPDTHCIYTAAQGRSP